MLSEASYRELGKSGIRISPIAFGAWGIGGQPFWESQGDKASMEALESALDLGVNFFDTAPVYGFGRSEELIGKVFREKRHKVVIATKCGLRWKSEETASIYNDLKPSSMREEVEASLRRLKTDYIDLYQIHWPSKGDPLDATMEELLKLKEEGKIRAIGVSNFDKKLLGEAMETTGVDSVQPKYNLLERGAEGELLPFCGESGIGVIVYSPLASGLLTGKYSSSDKFTDWRGSGKFGIFRKETIGSAFESVEKLKTLSKRMGRTLTELAINWVLANPGVTSALVGVKDSTQLKTNVEYLEKPLSSEEVRDVEQVA